jgi:FHS family L-fucose permease-like MFS transporter
VGCLLITSLFMSVMFPTIFALAIKGKGANTKTAGSIVVMAMIGGAALTKIMGYVSVKTNIEVAYLVPIAAYIGIALYAWLGAERRVNELAS